MRSYERCNQRSEKLRVKNRQGKKYESEKSEKEMQPGARRKKKKKRER
jgi:hypothetical protein